MDELQSSAVHRNLDSKLKILGMEAQDLIFVMLFASIMNLIFGKTSLSFVLVFVVPAIMGVILFFAKRGKPEGYLIHLIRYYVISGFYSAAQDSKNHDKMRGKIYEG